MFERLFGLGVILHLGGLAGAAGIGHREHVVVRGVIGMLRYVGPSLINRHFGWRGGEGNVSEQQNG